MDIRDFQNPIDREPTPHDETELGQAELEIERLTRIIWSLESRLNFHRDEMKEIQTLINDMESTIGHECGICTIIKNKLEKFNL
jgi:hypothetical protein